MTGKRIGGREVLAEGVALLPATDHTIEITLPVGKLTLDFSNAGGAGESVIEGKGDGENMTQSFIGPWRFPLGRFARMTTNSGVEMDFLVRYLGPEEGPGMREVHYVLSR